MVTKILTTDLLITDITVTLREEDKALLQLIEENEMKWAGKKAIDYDQFRKFNLAISSIPHTSSGGGSAANLAVTLHGLLGDEIATTFVGISGVGTGGLVIRDALEAANVRLVPENMHARDGMIPEGAISFVINPPPSVEGGDRTIATYPGNAAKFLTPEIITEEMVANTDVIALQGSVWQKLGEKFADRIMELRWNEGKELWLSMPTHSKFGTEKADFFQYAMTSANVVLANDEEIARIAKTNGDVQAALEQMQKLFQRNELEKAAKRGEWTGPTEQVGYVTLGRDGSAVVTADNIKYIKTKQAELPIYKLGAGDTACAGFGAGHLKSLEPQISADIGNTLSGEKLKVNKARLDDPRATLNEVRPDLAAELGINTLHATSMTEGAPHNTVIDTSVGVRIESRSKPSRYR